MSSHLESATRNPILFRSLAAIICVVLFICGHADVEAQLVLGPKEEIPKSFIRPGKPLVPVRKVSTGRVIHRFHDTSPLSPSGRYMALFRVPFEDRYPEAGDTGEVIIVDMKTGKEKVIATSRGWEMQVGANVQWGGSDEELYFNDVDTSTWEAFAIKLNPLTGKSKRMEGTVFMASQDGKQLVSYLMRTNITAGQFR